MSQETNGGRAPCVSCTGLKSGTRSSQEPHEYLYRTSSNADNAVTTYRCLLCASNLNLERSDSLAKWS